MIGQGDKLIVWKLDRLARNTGDICKTVVIRDEWPGRIQSQMIVHIFFCFSNQKCLIRDPMVSGGVKIPKCDMNLFQMLGVFAEFETKPLIKTVRNHQMQLLGTIQRENIMQNNEYSDQYSDDSFWDKVKNFAKAAGEQVLEPALKLYYAAKDKDTPTWAKGAIYGALGYFISPIDAIPDMTPFVGYADDLGVLALAVTVVAANIKPEHAEKAKETLKQWFGK